MDKERQKSIARIRIPVLQKKIKKYQEEIDKHILVLTNKYPKE
jgi:hypothetical protein